MKTTRFSVAVLLPLLIGLMATTQYAHADCKHEGVTLKIKPTTLDLKPEEPKCMPVQDPGNFTYTFPIELKPTGQVDLRDGQVHVRKVRAKNDSAGNPYNCSDKLEFAAPEFTNVGENDIMVTVIGDESTLGETICYDVEVDDIGKLDPRAMVDDQVAFMGNRNEEQRALIQAYDLLSESNLGNILNHVSLVDFLIDGYDMSEEEARSMIRRARESQNHHE